MKCTFETEMAEYEITMTHYYSSGSFCVKSIWQYFVEQL